MGIYKHCVSMSVDRREVTEVHADHVVVVEYLKPDPKGPFLVMSDYDEPTWAARKTLEPRATDSASGGT